MSKIPASDHPWRRYQNKAREQQSNGPSQVAKRPLQFLINDLSSNWTRVQISVKYHGHYDSYSLLELPDAIVANWLNGMLKRYTTETYEETEEDLVDQVG